MPPDVQALSPYAYQKAFSLPLADWGSTRLGSIMRRIPRAPGSAIDCKFWSWRLSPVRWVRPGKGTYRDIGFSITY